MQIYVKYDLSHRSLWLDFNTNFHFISDVLKVFQDQNGQFSCSAIQTEGKTRSVLNLLRASLIAFPGEKVMEEAEIFATTYLKEALKNIQVSSLSVEVRLLQ